MEEFKGWSGAHSTDTDGLNGLIACVKVRPPAHIKVLRQLKQVSKQKRVFEARWQVGRRVVLKQFLDTAEAATLVEREELNFPLTMSNPHIIESFVIANDLDPPEKFVVEEYLPSILDKNWSALGIEEAANLLVDIATALTYIHGKHKLVHSDIKPDNIGLRGNRFLLLDFGTAKHVDQLTSSSHPSGTLRTRAPELLTELRYPKADDAHKADVWALGATIFRGFTGRFPLLKRGERTPATSNPKRRQEFEAEMRRRADKEWHIWLDVKDIPPPLRPIVLKMLSRQAGDRPTSLEVAQRAHEELAEYLRDPMVAVDPTPMKPEDEVRQIAIALAKSGVIRLVPKGRRLEIRDRMTEILELELEPSIRKDAQSIRDKVSIA